MKNEITSGIPVWNSICSPSGRTNGFKRLFTSGALAFLGIYFYAVPLPAQTADTQAECSGTITYSDGASITVRTRQENFQTVGILPRETVNIELQLPLQFVNTPVAVQALDGGLVSENIVIAADGTGVLAFQAGMQPGLYRILLSARGRSAMLQFSVPDSRTP